MTRSSFTLARSGFGPIALTILLVGAALAYAFW